MFWGRAGSDFQIAPGKRQPHSCPFWHWPPYAWDSSICRRLKPTPAKPACSRHSHFCCQQWSCERWAKHTFRSDSGDGYFSKPEGIDVFEALLPGDVIDNDDGMGALVVGPSNGPEPFLASGVPDLQLDHIPLNSQRPTITQAYLNLKSTPIVAR